MKKTRWVLMAAGVFAEVAAGQTLGVYQKCELAIHDVALLEDAQDGYGCHVANGEEPLRGYYIRIRRYRDDFCRADSWSDLTDRLRAVRQENRRQYELTESIQGKERAPAVYCNGLKAYTLRGRNFPPDR